MSRRRQRRRSAGLRNGLRLTLFVAALGAVNVYVFFFKQGTAIRDVLKPASTVRSAESVKADVLREAAHVPTSGRAVAGKGSGGGAAAMRMAAGAGSVGGAPSVGFTAGGEGAQAPGEGGAHVVEGRIGPSDHLHELLVREGFGAQADNVIKALARLVDPKLIRAGESFVVRFDDEGTAESFEYQPTPALRYTVTRAPDGTWQAARGEKPLDTRVVEAAGVVESSLYESVHRAGEASALVSLLVDMFAWDINFYIDTNPGDRWKVVVEKLYLGGQFYKYGHVLAAEYGGKVGPYRAFYWKSPSAPASAPGRYYDEKGQAVAKTFLKTPLRFVRISSKFDPKRFHPILHREKAHLGVDYAAPTGTPVWASASGRVVEVGMKRGSGNTIVISHSGGLASRYYHLSRYAKGLKPGMTVHQKDVIGYVGATGLATGPHLHFSVTKNGAFIDPSKMAVGREPPVADRTAFLEVVKTRLAALRSMHDTALARNDVPPSPGGAPAGVRK